jgi:hypothetical protein
MTQRPISNIQDIEDMKTKDEQINRTAFRGYKNMRAELPGYPLYPAAEDIFIRYKEETNMDPEDTSKTKETNEKAGTNNEKDFSDDVSGGDLDVPGSELDDEQERIGNEDEENNSYSLGGEGHDD